MGFTSMLASIVQMAQLKLQPACADDLPGYGHECWDLGRWMLIGNLTNFVIGPLYAWNLRFCLGETLMGVNYALSNVLRIANPLAFAVASVIVPHASSTYQLHGIARARRVMLRFGGLGALLLAPYLGFVFLFPEASIGLVYGFSAQAYVRWAMVLRFSAVATGLMYASIVTGAFLNGAQASKLATVGQFVYAAAAMGIAMPCVAMFGLIGVPIGWVISAAILFCTNLHFIFRIRDPKGLVVRPPQDSAQPPEVQGLDTIAPAV
jgi:O-antigen/teichoic acid export membrane protein